MSWLMIDPDLNDGDRLIVSLTRRGYQLEAMAAGLRRCLDQTLAELSTVTQHRLEITDLLAELR
jgi:hypothetical protein